MDYGLSLCRDTLTLNDKLAGQLAQRLAAGEAPLGSPVLIAARELRGVGDFQLFGHDLVLLADQLDGGQGQVIVSAPVGEAGRHVTVGCRKLLGLNVQAPGGEGAGGESGTPGKPGKPGFQGRKPGEPGGRGGDGGRGGEVEVLYLQDAVPGGFDPAARPPTTSHSASTSTSCRPAGARPRPRPCTSPSSAPPRLLPP
jgi:hypothetical protein